MVVSNAVDEVNKSTTFGKIKTNVEWLGKYNDKEYSLNLAKYKEEQKQLKAVYKQIEDLYKLPQPLYSTWLLIQQPSIPHRIKWIKTSSGSSSAALISYITNQ